MIVILSTGEQYEVHGDIEIREGERFPGPRVRFLDVRGNLRIFDAIEIARIVRR